MQSPTLRSEVLADYRAAELVADYRAAELVEEGSGTKYKQSEIPYEMWVHRSEMANETLQLRVVANENFKTQAPVPVDTLQWQGGLTSPPRDWMHDMCGKGFYRLPSPTMGEHD